MVIIESPRVVGPSSRVRFWWRRTPEICSHDVTEPTRTTSMAPMRNCRHPGLRRSDRKVLQLGYLGLFDSYGCSPIKKTPR
jgi:hypothetical protein